MKVKEIMSVHPIYCSPLTKLKEVAQMMVDENCAGIPVVENIIDCKLIGMITDHDIICRALARGLNPLEMTAGECMSQSCVSVHLEASIDDCYKIFKEHGLQLLSVIDDKGACRGVISYTDLREVFLDVK